MPRRDAESRGPWCHVVHIIFSPPNMDSQIVELRLSFIVLKSQWCWVNVRAMTYGTARLASASTRAGMLIIGSCGIARTDLCITGELLGLLPAPVD